MRKDPIEPVEVGHRTSSLCHVANIAMKLKRKLTSDPERELIVNDEEANKLLDRPMRNPWQLALAGGPIRPYSVDGRVCQARRMTSATLTMMTAGAGTPD